MTAHRNRRDAIPSFKDNAGREWLLKLDAPLIRAVRQDCDGLDLAGFDGKQFTRLSDDPCLLVDCLWVLCRKQAESRSISAEQFAESLVGDAIERATAAMLESIADFFPKSKRDHLCAVQEKNRRLQELGIAKALEKLNDPELERKVLAGIEAQMDEQISRVLTRLSVATSLPEPVASPPAD